MTPADLPSSIDTTTTHVVVDNILSTINISPTLDVDRSSSNISMNIHIDPKSYDVSPIKNVIRDNPLLACKITEMLSGLPSVEKVQLKLRNTIVKLVITHSHNNIDDAVRDIEPHVLKIISEFNDICFKIIYLHLDEVRKMDLDDATTIFETHRVQTVLDNG